MILACRWMIQWEELTYLGSCNFGVAKANACLCSELHSYFLAIQHQIPPPIFLKFAQPPSHTHTHPFMLPPNHQPQPYLPFRWRPPPHRAFRRRSRRRHSQSLHLPRPIHPAARERAPERTGASQHRLPPTLPPPASSLSQNRSRSPPLGSDSHFLSPVF